MAISLDQFSRAAAAGGLLKLDSGGSGDRPGVSSMGFFGRVAQWFPGDSAKAENRQVMRSFVAALGQQFGASFATRVGDRLDVESGRPLNARDVTRIIGQGREHMRQVAGLNAATAFHFSENTAPGERNSFGHVFDNMAAEKGLNVLAGDKDLNLASLQRAIRKDIGHAGIGNKVVSMEQARAIAEKHVGRFIDNKLALMQAVDRLTTDEGERATLRRIALSHDVSKPQFLETMWRNRDAAQDLIAALGDPEASQADQLGALNTFFGRYDAALSPLIATMSAEDVGADDLIDFNSNLLETGLIMSGLDPQGTQALWSTLTSPQMGQLRDALNHLYTQGVEQDIGARSLSTMRSFGDTIGALIALTGKAAGRPADEIDGASVLEHGIGHVDEIPEQVIDTLRALGMGDVEFTIEKQIERADPEVRQKLGDALLNLNLTREVMQGGDAGQLLAQAHVLSGIRARLSGIEGDAAEKLRGLFDRPFTQLVDAYCEAVRRDGPGQDDIVRGLRQAQEVLAGFRDAGVPADMASRCEERRIDLQSEIFTRSEPHFRELDAETQALSVGNRQEFGRIISHDLRQALDRPIGEESRPELARLSAGIRERAAGLGLDGADRDRFAAAMERIDGIRMGSSDTIAGKSGGGEVAEGRNRATGNWNAANALAGEIARGGGALTLDHIKQLNRLLNDGMPANEGMPGEFRERPETAGGGSAYLTPERIPLFMDEFMGWLNEGMGRTDPIELAGLAYQKLVSIHPFADANGRTCRLVADIILQRHGLPPAAFQGSDEVNVGVFGVPQKGHVNIAPEEAVRRMASAVNRSVSILAGEPA